jgi:hypothetical protein
MEDMIAKAQATVAALKKITTGDSASAGRLEAAEQALATIEQCAAVACE